MLYAGVRAHAGGGIDVNQLFGHHHLKCMKFLISLESQEPLKSLKYSKFLKLRNLRSLFPAKKIAASARYAQRGSAAVAQWVVGPAAHMRGGNVGSRPGGDEPSQPLSQMMTMTGLDLA